MISASFFLSFWRRRVADSWYGACGRFLSPERSQSALGDILSVLMLFPPDLVLSDPPDVPCISRRLIPNSLTSHPPTNHLECAYFYSNNRWPNCTVAFYASAATGWLFVLISSFITHSYPPPRSSHTTHEPSTAQHLYC